MFFIEYLLVNMNIREQMCAHKHTHTHTHTHTTHTQIHAHKIYQKIVLKYTGYRRSLRSGKFSCRSRQTCRGSALFWPSCRRQLILGNYTHISSPGTRVWTISRTAPVNRTERRDEKQLVLFVLRINGWLLYYGQNVFPVGLEVNFYILVRWNSSHWTHSL